MPYAILFIECPKVDKTVTLIQCKFGYKGGEEEEIKSMTFYH